jgi:hypothetical protein
MTRTESFVLSFQDEEIFSPLRIKKFFHGPLIFLTTGTTNLIENQCRQVLFPCGFRGGSVSTASRAQKFSASTNELAVSVVDKKS